MPDLIAAGRSALSALTRFWQDPSTDALEPYVRVAGAPVTPTDRSGTIVTAATAQQLMAANARRTGFWVQNLSTGDLWISALGAATAGQPSLRLPPGALYEAPATGVPTAAISILGATSGAAFSAREW